MKKAELVAALADHVGVRDHGEGSLRSPTLAKIGKELGRTDVYGGGPSKRQKIRLELAQRRSDGPLVEAEPTDNRPLRKDELEELYQILVGDEL